MPPHKRSRSAAAVGSWDAVVDDGADGGDDYGVDDGVAVTTPVEGMKAHNRRVAAIWRIGDGAAAICKVKFTSQYIQQLHTYVRRHWLDGAKFMPLVDAGASVKAKLEGFGSYGNTTKELNAELQRQHTLLILPELVVKCHLFLPCFTAVVTEVTDHARQWCALTELERITVARFCVLQHT